MLTFVLILMLLLGLMGLRDRKESDVSLWNDRQEFLQFKQEVEGLKYSPLM